MSDNRALIQVRGLSHTYLPDTPFAQVALRDVDLTVAEGERIGIVGGTGAGKSTLLQHLNGLYRPQVGSVVILGRDLADRAVDVREVRRLVGLVFQRPEQQLFAQYVGDDVAYGPQQFGLMGDALRERVRRAMEWAGLDFAAYKDRLTWTLSGGEQRKAALAGVLALQPRILVLDEPTAGLDPQARLDLLARLQELHRQGLTLVVASHNMDDIARLTDRVYVLQEGRVVLQGPTREVFAHGDRLREVGLDVPPAAQVAGTLRAAGIPLAVGTLTLAELADEVARWLEGAR